MYILSAITFLVWVIPFLFSKNEQIENVLQVNYVQVDSAHQLLLSKKKQLYTTVNKRNLEEEQKSIEKPYGERGREVIKESTYFSKKKQIQFIDINKADSTQFEQLPAIGEKLSSRIVRYRERLGGFIQIEQVKEVYGISDSAFGVILPYLRQERGFLPQKIDINKADYAMLRRHPYADHVFIKLVLAYRKSHGPFKQKEDLEKIIQLDKTVLNKLIPYLSFED